MQKKWNIIAILAVLLFATAAVAAGGSEPGAVPGYKYCIKKVSGVWALSQQPESHYEDYWGGESCYDLWTDVYPVLEEKMSGDEMVELGSDIDFGGVKSDSSACVADFKPLPAWTGKVFNGNHHTIKNLCYITSTVSQTSTNFGVGFFSQIEGGAVSNMNFENVYFKVENKNPSVYIIQVGVVAGRAIGSSIFSDIVLKNVKVDAIQSGGVVGYSEQNANNTGWPIFKNISGENVEVYASKDVMASEGENYIYVSYPEQFRVYLGGLVGEAKSGIFVVNVGIRNLWVHSDLSTIKLWPQQIDPQETYEATDQLLDQFLGGLAGRLENPSNTINIANTYTIGDISSVESGSQCRVGFVAGYTKLTGSSTFVGYNYHYGESDYNALNAMGELFVGNTDVASSWYQAVDYDSHVFNGGLNYRNAIAKHITATADMDTVSYRASGSMVNFGGYLADSLMKKDAFAAVLNEYGSSDANRWSRKSGVNEGLPVFSTEGLKPIYRIEFYGEGEYAKKATAAEKKKWTDAGGKIHTSQNETFMEISVLTDYTGKLGNSIWQSNAASIGNGKYYWNYYDEQSGRNSGLTITKSTVFNSPMYLYLKERVSVTVVHGFVEYGNNSAEFFSIEDFAKRMHKNYYFMGVPADKINSDSAWVRVPYLASAGENGYEYYGYSFEKKVCSVSGGQKECSFVTLETSGYGKFYVDALVETDPDYGIASGDTLYVVYLPEPRPTELGAGGRLFVSDLHGEGFDQNIASVQVRGIISDTLSLFGSPSSILVPEWDSDMIDKMLNDVGDAAVDVPYSPYLKANYPSDFWKNVQDIVALVAVGGSSDGGNYGAEDLLQSAARVLSSIKLSYSLLKDTVSALESPIEIRANMDSQIRQGSSLVYARYVRLGRDGKLDLTNLLAAVASVQSYDVDYPVYVGLIPQLTAMQYHVSFDVDVSKYSQGDYSTLFVGDALIDKNGIPDSTYTEGTGSASLIRIYEWRLFRTDACYKGMWKASVSSGDYHGSTDLYSISSLEEEEGFPFVENKDGSRSLTVHPYWEEGDDESVLSSCYELSWPSRVISTQEGLRWNNYIVEDHSAGGNIVLQQVWNGDTLRHMSTYLPEGVTGIYVPYADSVEFTFEVFADGYPGFELDGNIKLYRNGTDGQAELLKEGDTVQVYEWYRGGMEFYADYTYKKFNIGFVSGKKDVLYGENSDSVGVYKLESEGDSLDLPRWVYTEDNCVEGWMIQPEDDEDEVLYPVQSTRGANNHKEHNIVYNAFDFLLSAELDEQNGKRLVQYPLYAKWVDAGTCVKDYGYSQAKLTVAENGLVEFKELRYGSAGKVKGFQVHKFAKDSTMLLPSKTDGKNFIVQGVPAKGYVLDSLIMILDRDTLVYHEGDTLSGDIAHAIFEAYFMLDNTTPAEFVKAELLQSGSAIRFEFVTSEFGVSGASVKIVLEDDDGKAVADTVLAVPATPYADSWEYFPLRAGTYLLTATVKNSRSSSVFEKDFEVKSTIASKKDGWQMLSLSNVIMDSVTWDDDVRFFWWDDARDYGAYWRYQSLTKKDKVDDLTGYWYSSLEGRPLVMRKDMLPPKSPVVWDLDSVYTGWNLVANPYGWYVDLYGENQDKKKSSTEETDIEFWSWNDSLSAYEEVDVVGPYEAVWVKVKAPGKWKLPSMPTFVATVDENGNDSLTKPLKKTVELASDRSGNWAIRAVLRDAKGKRDGWNIMGVSESGWSAEEPPTGMGDHVNLSIKDGDRSLAKSFKAASGDSYEWTVSLDASGNRTGYLHFEGLDAVREAGLKVFVTVDGTTTQMAENDTLKVSIGSMAKTATVRVAPSARTIVAQKLNGLRAFQSGSSLQVGFQVSESLAGARAYVEILDMKGKVLSSTSGTAVSGSNALTLQAPKSGLYMVRVRVGSKQAAGSIAVR